MFFLHQQDFLSPLQHQEVCLHCWKIYYHLESSFLGFRFKFLCISSRYKKDKDKAYFLRNIVALLPWDISALLLGNPLALGGWCSVAWSPVSWSGSLNIGGLDQNIKDFGVFESKKQGLPCQTFELELT